MSESRLEQRNQTLKIVKRTIPYLLLALALTVFYDLLPLTHLPLPATAREDCLSTEPLIVGSRLNALTDTTTIDTQRGPLLAKVYAATKATTGVVLVGGIGGDTTSATFDSPAANVYERLGKDLQTSGITTVQISFRKIDPFQDTVYDVRAAVLYLKLQGIKRVILIGHSLGGAAVVSAASFEPKVAGVVALCSQPYGADRVRALKDKRLLIGCGLMDVVEPPCWSKAIYRAARCDKSLVYFPGFHNLETCSDQVFKSLKDFVTSCEQYD